MTKFEQTEFRDRLIDRVSVGNLRHRPEALFSLFRKFLQRISLPRLIHFFDLVLPQLMPVQAACAGEGRNLWSCHHIRYLHTLEGERVMQRVRISYLFTSHDHIHHVRIQWEGHPLLLFSDPKMVSAQYTDKFREQSSHVTHQQHLQIGLRKGMAILVYYVVGDTKFQTVLLTHDSVLGRGGKNDNRLWKRVTPIVTEFAWLPPAIAESFCSTALYRDEARTYHAFNTPRLGLGTKFDAHMLIEDIFYLGDTRRADDLAVFTGMPPERLCLGCGLRVEEPFAPLTTGERSKLFTAAHKLLLFVLHDVSAQTFSVEEQALLVALKPLIDNGDCHFVAAVTSLVQSLLEGRTDCPISGVFGAGKTLSAAAMIAGLLVMDPTLKIMIVTKENVAAHAFAKHFLRLGLPDSINSLVGRLVVGYVELQKGPANKTDLDVPPAFRNDVLRSKQVLIGCGGGFHQECSQPYSPVAKWIEDADVALNDEGQQYGNLDEASAVARTPRKCLVIWCGDHKQTPGGSQGL